MSAKPVWAQLREVPCPESHKAAVRMLATVSSHLEFDWRKSGFTAHGRWQCLIPCDCRIHGSLLLQSQRERKRDRERDSSNTNTTVLYSIITCIASPLLYPLVTIKSKALPKLRGEDYTPTPILADKSQGRPREASVCPMLLQVLSFLVGP